MTNLDNTSGRRPKWMMAVAVVAAVFGVLTVFSGGSVLFGPTQAQKAAGAIVPFVVWFNFLAGFAYLVAAFGIWMIRDWALGLSVFIAVATAGVAMVFGYQVSQGIGFEMRTVGALAFRFVVWAAIALALFRAGRPE